MFQNPFLIIRYACFSIILFLDILTLVFAAWNVALMKSSGEAAPGASVLLLFNGAAIILAILIGLVELVVVRVKTAKVKVECTWTAIMALLQLAAALTITTTGPPLLCRDSSNLAACTSVTVLVPVSWLSSFTIVAYFLTLTITTIVYTPSYPDVWSMSVYDVPWFISRVPPPLGHKSSGSTSSSKTIRVTQRARCIWDDDVKDEEEAEPPRARSCLSLPVAPWARSYQKNRRGLDRPFATRSQVIAANPDIPVPPPKAYPLPIAARYLEISRPFPIEADHDKPLPQTLSQWVRADIAEGRDVHTRPPITPR